MKVNWNRTREEPFPRRLAGKHWDGFDYWAQWLGCEIWRT